MSLALRGAIAVLLLLGYYLLALGIGGGLLAIPLGEWLYLHRVTPKLDFICIFAGGTVLWSAIPRWDRFEAPGPRLVREDDPRLFAVIDEVAGATGQAGPAEVYLVPDVNAWVATRGGVMGLGGRRIMGLGLPLLQALRVDELRAVLAHEFGHYHGGDTRLGPFLYQARSAIQRTVMNLAKAGSSLNGIFVAYFKLFLRVSHGVSRHQEYTADAVASRVTGPDAMKRALVAVSGAAPAFSAYASAHLDPAISAGKRPPIAAGFGTYLNDASVRAQVEGIVSANMKAAADPLDTHPSLAERIAALGALPAVSPVPPDNRPAISLLSDLPGTEALLLASMLPDKRLEAVGWDGFAAVVELPALTRIVAGAGADGVDPADAPAHLANPLRFLATLSLTTPITDPKAAGGAALRVVYGRTVLRLLEVGWSATHRPGPGLLLQRDGEEVDPWPALAAQLEGDAARQAWPALWASWSAPSTAQAPHG